MNNITMRQLEDARWRALSKFNLDKPGGDLKKDLFENKRVLVQRGVNIKSVERAPDLGTGVYQFIASTDGIKRDGNMVMNSGWHFENFEKNPAFIWCHDYHSLPIGRHVKWEVSGSGDSSVLRIWSQFCSEDMNPFAERVRKMYDEGFLRAVSIGWAPIKWEWIISEDEDGDIEGIRFTESDLLEVSAVPVPSDPDAIIEAVHRNIISSSDIDRMSEYGMLPKISRGVAYTISNSDIPTEKIERSEEVEETKEETNMDMQKIVEAIDKLGEEVRAVRDDIEVVKTRLQDPPTPVEPTSIDPEEPKEEEPSATEERSIVVEPEAGPTEVPDEEKDDSDTMIPSTCNCDDHRKCSAACSDHIKRCMSHVAGLAARCMELDRALPDGVSVESIALIRSELDELVGVVTKLSDSIVERTAVKPEVEPVTEVEPEVDEVAGRLDSLSRELGLTVEPITTDDVFNRAVEMGLIGSSDPAPVEPEATVEEDAISDEDADLIEKMLKSLNLS